MLAKVEKIYSNQNLPVPVVLIVLVVACCLESFGMRHFFSLFLFMAGPALLS